MYPEVDKEMGGGRTFTWVAEYTWATLCDVNIPVDQDTAISDLLIFWGGGVVLKQVLKLAASYAGLQKKWQNNGRVAMLLPDPEMTK